ncbi:uncharacterized protein PV07_05115 [Cladophialophora immunda]|uniref:Uncharacterized protein n=1 Tax=Cladophialophora immunda TaxID=569365 RepID=A0A0D2CGE5_9EURO|nr:uncharacterized protein PV07_05115 [Cladophialophora immunda]KIW29290.1 hypothetical protein PV07_05115 [Cladophialophora immunda]
MADSEGKQQAPIAAEVLPGPAIQQIPASAPLLQQTAHVPKGWPTSPKTIKSSIGSVLTDLVVDSLLLAFSVAFLAFGLVVKLYDQAPTALHKHTANTLLSATKYGPSVFPILFACILGRAAHAILVWRLEKGERVGILDLLAGSTSLTSTVTSQLKLRIASFLGVALIAIWSLSPVGGQASFRQMTIGSNISSQPSEFTYMVYGGTFDQFDDSDRVSYYAIVNTLFVASIISPESTKSSPRDTWGNVKIPMIEHYENSSTIDDDGWFITLDGEQSTYSSIVGIPIAGVDSTDFINYATNIETAYFRLDCPVVNGTWKTNLPVNNSVTGDGAYMWWYDNSTQRIQQAQTDVESLKPLNFTYVVFWPGGGGGEFDCTITTTYVEVEILCPTMSTCAASKARRSRLQHPPAAFTQLDLNSYANYGNLYLFASAFVTSITAHPSTSTLVQTYLIDSSNPAGISLFNSDYVQPSPKELLAVRLNQLMNAYWTCINGIYAVSGGINPQTTYLGNNNASTDTVLANSTTVKGTKSTKTEVIQCHDGWVVALALASIVMIVASLVRPIVRCFLTQAPDVMLNISSLATRNNPYMALPTNGTFMAASDRAKLLKNLKVRLGDVEGAADIGSLAIGSLGVAGVSKVANVRKDRLYE